MSTLFYVCILAGVLHGNAIQPKLGGLSQSPNEDDSKRILDFATQQINLQMHPSSRFIRLVPINVKKQVVSGMSYHVDVDMYATQCFIYQLGDELPGAECPLGTLLTTTPCSIQIWEQPWAAEPLKLVESKCVTKAIAPKPIVSDLLTTDAFQAFMATYNKTYSSEEERNHRFKIFRQNMVTAFKLQAQERGSAVYGPSIFADLTNDEFRAHHLGLKPVTGRIAKEEPIFGKDKVNVNSKITAELPTQAQPTSPQDDSLPASWDWRQHGAVTPVKNQGMCGSCWAFSATGNIEGQWALKNKQLVPLSEQELLDCDTVDGACGGGFMWDAYQAVETIGGLDSETDYPYEAQKESQCNFDKTKVKATVSGWVNISNDENEMAKWLYSNGPISIGINANAMQFYMGGVSHPPSFLCNPTGIDHGVLIVGYGKTWLLRTPYWIVKNSWGTGWGEKGYYRVYRGGGVCGLNTVATSATV